MNCEDKSVISTFDEYASMSGYTWDKDCVARVWSKHPERWEETKKATEKSPYSPYDVVSMFIDWVDKHCKDIEDVFLISDNVAFDVGTLRFFSRARDVMYLINGKYREVIDVTSLYYGLSLKRITIKTFFEEDAKSLAHEGLASIRWGLELPKPNIEASKNHQPVDDALEIAYYYCWFQDHLPIVRMTE